MLKQHALRSIFQLDPDTLPDMTCSLLVQLWDKPESVGETPWTPIAEWSPDWQELGVKIRDYPQLKEVTYPWGVKLCAVAGSAHSLTGKRFKLAVIDEPASFPNTRGQRVFNALRTGLGKTPGSKLVVCGTRPSDGAGHWFEDLLKSSGLIWQRRTGTPIPLDPKTMEESANPSSGSYLDLRPWKLPSKRNPKTPRNRAAAMASFRNLRLNIGEFRVS